MGQHRIASHQLYHCRARQRARTRQREPLSYYLGFDSRAGRSEHRPGIEGLVVCRPAVLALQLCSIESVLMYGISHCTSAGRQAAGGAARHVQAMAVRLMELSCMGRILLCY